MKNGPWNVMATERSSILSVPDGLGIREPELRQNLDERLTGVITEGSSGNCSRDGATKK